MCILNMCIEYFSITNAMESRYIDSRGSVRVRGSSSLHGPTIIIIHNYDCKMRYYFKKITMGDFWAVPMPDFSPMPGLDRNH